MGGIGEKGDGRVIVGTGEEFSPRLIVNIINMSIGDRVGEDAGPDAEFGGENVGQKRESGHVVRASEDHVIGPDDIVEMERAAHHIDREGIGAGDVFLGRASAEAVVPRVPGHDDPMSRAGHGGEVAHEVAQLVSAEMSAPSVSVRRGHRPVGLGEFLPNAGEMVDIIIGIVGSVDIPDHLGHKEGDRDFAEGEEGERFGEVHLEGHSWKCLDFMARSFVEDGVACLEDISEGELVLRVEGGHRVMGSNLFLC